MRWATRAGGWASAASPPHSSFLPPASCSPGELAGGRARRAHPTRSLLSSPSTPLVLAAPKKSSAQASLPSHFLSHPFHKHITPQTHPIPPLPTANVETPAFLPHETVIQPSETSEMTTPQPHSRPTNNQLLYKAHFRWKHYTAPLSEDCTLPVATGTSWWGDERGAAGCAPRCSPHSVRVVHPHELATNSLANTNQQP